jgi:hypothetical protein
MSTSRIIAIWFFILLVLSATAQPKIEDTDTKMLHRAEKALTDVIVQDIFSPPVASRIYLYTNMAAYETCVPLQQKFQSLTHSIPGFPHIHFNGNPATINAGLAAVYAFMKTGGKLVFSEEALQDSLKAILINYQSLPQAVYDHSIAFGQQVSDSIIAWAAGDQYTETRKLRRYSFYAKDGKWIPTPPGYMAAIEPNWNKIRTICMDSASEFKPDPPPVFSKDSGSVFFQNAYQVYSTGNTLTQEQRAVALFWDCNPFFLNIQGHLHFATKKLSPGGHWISIAGIASRTRHADLVTSVAAYTITAIALFDGFISCWDEKYRSNLIRPETYINANIDETWRPLLQTPPFPEYTSGHSVISTAAAVVLSDFYGEQFRFDDSSELEYGLPVRTFQSFMDAANEAAISRNYGGIHYMPAIENGQKQGLLVGKKVLSRIQLLSFRVK